MFRVEMLPAGHGDSLVIAYGTEAAPRYVLIDGGPFYTYNGNTLVERAALSRRVQQLITEGHPIELLVVTHVDGDHIEGIVRLLGSWPDGLKVDDVWFNAWRHLAPTEDDLLGPVQGEMLSAVIQKRGLTWNTGAGDKAVAVRPSAKFAPICLPGGLELTILSPTFETLGRLRTAWQAEVTKAGLHPGEPEAALERLKSDKRLKPDEEDDLLGEKAPDVESLAASPFDGDASEANGSSIAFIAEYKGSRCLFGADAHPDVLERSLRDLLAARGEQRLRLDALKVPHHGSKNNLSASLLSLVDCPRYLISTNGAVFHHPDQEAVARILLHGGRRPTLFFNYLSERNRMWDDTDLKDRYGYRAVYGSGDRGGLAIDLQE